MFSKERLFITNAVTALIELFTGTMPGLTVPLGYALSKKGRVLEV